MSELQSVQGRRLEEAVKGSVVALGVEMRGLAGETKVLAGIALDMLERLGVDIGGALESQKKEGLEASAAEREAERAGKRAAPLVVQFHARANAWLWTQRAGDAASGVEVDLTGKNYALSQWLEGVNPSAFASMTPAAQADFLASIITRKGDILTGSEADKKLGEGLDEAAAAVGAASEALRKEKGEADAAAREVSAALIEGFGRRYQAAQDVLRAALRLQGRLDLLDALLPSFWGVIEPSKRRADEPAEEPAPVA